MAGWIDGQVIDRTEWTNTHFSLRIACARPAFVPGQFVRVALDVDGVQVARPYSCVNSVDSEDVEIFFNVVPEGPLSKPLADLSIGDTIQISDRCNGLLTLKEIPESARDLWMIATGTGVGPFLSILQSAETWQRFKNLILVYGVREADQIAYRPLINALHQAHPTQLRFIPCVTHQAPADAYPGRVTLALSDGQLEARANTAIDLNSHFMLCGNTAMIKDMSEALKLRGLKKHLRREPGHISSEKYH